MALQAGDKAPSFDLPSTSGGTISLESLRGKKVVLFFYPKDNTPGCTREAKDFRDHYQAFQKAGAEIFGISKDSLASHDRFRAKQDLPFHLLTDADNAVATAFGAFGPKKLYGREYQGTIRSTFLIDEEGTIGAAWPKVKVAGHAEEVLATVLGEG